MNSMKAEELVLMDGIVHIQNIEINYTQDYRMRVPDRSNLDIAIGNRSFDMDIKISAGNTEYLKEFLMNMNKPRDDVISFNKKGEVFIDPRIDKNDAILRKIEELKFMILSQSYYNGINNE